MIDYKKQPKLKNVLAHMRNGKKKGLSKFKMVKRI